MEEVLKRIFIKVKFLYNRFILKNPLIREIEKDYQSKNNELKKEREKKYLENHIPYNLNNYRLINYKNKYFGERCFIIGNGPSLKAKDLEKITGEYSFGANTVFKIFKDTSWRPSFYFVEDSLVYENHFKEIKKIEAPKFVSSIALEWQKLPLLKNGIKFFDYLYYYNHYPETPPLTVDFTKEVWCMYNVGAQMINAAIYMGFKKIYLLGFDFSYDFSGIDEVTTKNDKGEVETKFIVKKKMKNHFSDECVTIGQEVYLTDTKYALKAFELLQKESKNLGIKIYNATGGGKLEIFERIKLDKVLEPTKNEEK